MNTAMADPSLRISPDVQKYFGKYGGFFVPDPFTPALDALAVQYGEAVSKAAFKALFQDALDVLGPEPLSVSEAGSVGQATQFVAASQAREAIIAGYVALARTFEANLAAGVRERDHALSLASTSKQLGVKLDLWLNRALAADEKLVTELKDMGAGVDVEKTGTLFDDPEMYAFQRYISDPTANLFAPLNTNVGPYPFLSITGAFTAAFGEALRQAVEKALGGSPGACVLPGFPGTEAVGLIRAMQGSEVQLVTFEAPFDKEREDCYCGAYTRVTQMGEAENVLSPELLAAWEEGTVERVQAADAKAAIKKLSLSGDVLVVEV